VDRYLITLVDKVVPQGDTFFDQEFLGDPDEWNITQLGHTPAGPDDEAAFTIFEVLARNPGLIRERRQQAIEAARAAATSGTQFRGTRARTARSPERQSYSML
jgi:hypothetical protein